MRKAIILSLLSILSIGMRAADYEYLVFTMTDGTQQAVTASDLTITFSGNNLIAASGNSTLATISLTSLSSMEFSSTTTDDTGIRCIDTNSLITDDNTVIYDMSGRMMPKNASLPKGAYILKNDIRTIKVQIK